MTYEIVPPGRVSVLKWYYESSSVYIQFSWGGSSDSECQSFAVVPMAKARQHLFDFPLPCSE